MQTLFGLDQSFFLILNHLPHGWLGNALGILLSGVGTAGFVWFALGLLFFLKEEKKDHWFFVPLIAAGGASWIIAEKILKPLIARPRPTAEMGAVILGIDFNTSYSFPSGHATIAWAMAVVLSRKEPKWRWIFYLLAILISFSRIYIGKHFPLDVVAGGLLGWGIGLLSLSLASRLKQNKK